MKKYQIWLTDKSQPVAEPLSDKLGVTHTEKVGSGAETHSNPGGARKVETCYSESAAENARIFWQTKGTVEVREVTK